MAVPFGQNPNLFDENPERFCGLNPRPVFTARLASLRRAKQKIFLYIFLSRAPKIFSIKEKKNFSVLIFRQKRNCGNAPTPTALRRGKAQAGKFLPPTPFLLPACFNAWGRREQRLQNKKKEEIYHNYNKLTLFFYPETFCYIFVTNQERSYSSLYIFVHRR